MTDIETLQISIHLNLLSAKTNMKEDNFELAIHRTQNARNLLEKLEALVQQNAINLPNEP